MNGLPKIDWDAVLDDIEMGTAALVVAREHGLSRGQISRATAKAGLRLVHGRTGGQAKPVLPDDFFSTDRAAITGHGRRLQHDERVFIQLRHADGWSMSRIARALGAATSTVSRELQKRPTLPDGSYSARRAHMDAQSRRTRPRKPKLDSHSGLRAQVVHWLNQKFSPRQIQHRLELEFPDQETMRVSHETIYQALYIQGRGSLREELKTVKALRSGRTQRKPRSKLPVMFQSWVTGFELSNRPATVADRAVPGHWEGDLIIGADHQSALITLVERTSRYVLIRRVPGVYTANTVANELINMMADVPARLRQTMTWDRGSEMANHADFTLATGTKVFFCDPHAPWQRGSNENTNGLIRDFYPKGTDFRSIPDDDIAQTQYLLNIRPRQTLQWQNPSERLLVALTT